MIEAIKELAWHVWDTIKFSSLLFGILFGAAFLLTIPFAVLTYLTMQ